MATTLRMDWLSMPAASLGPVNPLPALVLWSMKTLLQDGLQGYMPGSPEKRLLFNQFR